MGKAEVSIGPSVLSHFSKQPAVPSWALHLGDASCQCSGGSQDTVLAEEVVLVSGDQHVAWVLFPLILNDYRLYLHYLRMAVFTRPLLIAISLPQQLRFLKKDNYLTLYVHQGKYRIEAPVRLGWVSPVVGLGAIGAISTSQWRHLQVATSLSPPLTQPTVRWGPAGSRGHPAARKVLPAPCPLGCFFPALQSCCFRGPSVCAQAPVPAAHTQPPQGRVPSSPHTRHSAPVHLPLGDHRGSGMGGIWLP